MSELPKFEAVDVTYSFRDIAALNLVIWPFWAKLLAIIPAALIAAKLIFDTIDGYSLRGAIAGIDWRLVGMALGFSILWIFLVVVVAYWRQKKKGLLGPTQFAQTVEGISIRNRRMTGVVLWSAIQKIIVGHERLLLFVSRRSALIFPRRAFASNAAFAQFSIAAQERWKAHHRL